LLVKQTTKETKHQYLNNTPRCGSIPTVWWRPPLSTWHHVPGTIPPAAVAPLLFQPTTHRRLLRDTSLCITLRQWYQVAPAGTFNVSSSAYRTLKVNRPGNVSPGRSSSPVAPPFPLAPVAFNNLAPSGLFQSHAASSHSSLRICLHSSL
jgi:hypothetical protein